MSDPGDIDWAPACPLCAGPVGHKDRGCPELHQGLAGSCPCPGTSVVKFHKAEIPRGKYGELSKIREELLEAEDAEAQGIRVMLLLELGDIVGAVEGYLEKHFKGFTLEELIRFQRLRGAVSVAQGWSSK